MSAKIILYFPYVHNYKDMLEKNLRITFDDGYQKDNQIYDEFYSEFNDVLSDTTAIAYGAYYHKEQWLRHIYFDIVRALNLKDIWIFNEMIVYHFYDESNPIPSFYDFLKYMKFLCDIKFLFSIFLCDFSIVSICVDKIVFLCYNQFEIN